jgi:hypothetical protein
MALGRRREKFQQVLMVPTSALPRSPDHPFYVALNTLLAEAKFDAYVEGLCEPQRDVDDQPKLSASPQVPIPRLRANGSAGFGPAGDVEHAPRRSPLASEQGCLSEGSLIMSTSRTRTLLTGMSPKEIVDEAGRKGQPQHAAETRFAAVVARWFPRQASNEGAPDSHRAGFPDTRQYISSFREDE